MENDGRRRTAEHSRERLADSKISSFNYLLYLKVTLRKRPEEKPQRKTRYSTSVRHMLESCSISLADAWQV
jgi:hypothetical protein